MNKQIVRLLQSVILAASFVAAPSLADDENALKDPSFETELAPERGGWNLFGASGFDTSQARRGRQSMFNGAFFDVAGSFQAVPAKPGSRWRLTGYGLTPSPLLGAPAFGVVQFTFRDANGVDIGTVETAGQEFPALGSNPVDGGTPPNRWTFLDTGIGTAPPGAATIEAFTLYVDFSGGFQGVFFDDLNLCLLEEDDDDDELECVEFDDDDDSSDDDSSDDDSSDD